MATTADKPATNNLHQDRLRVLIADDAQETRRSARLMMTLLPMVEVVGVAENGRQAVEMTREQNPDIVVIDINMPEMDGLTAIKAMVRQRPQIACVIMSAHGDSDTVREAMASGARGYLVKPFTTDELLESMKRIIQVVLANRREASKTGALRRQRDHYLLELAGEYVKARRTDDRAKDVFEQLAADPDCDPQWMMALATIYLIKRQWRELKLISARLEQVVERTASK